MINRKWKLPVGQIVLAFNIIIYGIAALLFGFDRAMYSLLTYFIASKVIDFVENGMDQTKAAMIITNDAKDIISNIDSSAFITISDVGEIIGTHMKKNDSL
jgi:uncharacterized membrane-anchored protein YitT (DUF2179 family)